MQNDTILKFNCVNDNVVIDDCNDSIIRSISNRDYNAVVYAFKPINICYSL